MNKRLTRKKGLYKSASFRDWTEVLNELRAYEKTIQSGRLLDALYKSRHKKDFVAVKKILKPVAKFIYYRIRLSESEDGENNIKSWFATPSLWLCEAMAFSSVINHPNRSLCDWHKKPQRKVEIIPTVVSDIMNDTESINALLERLNDLTPYNPSSLPENPVWLWAFECGQHWNLLFNGKKIVKPPGWKNNEPYYFENMDTSYKNIIITDSKCFSGLASFKGKLIFPCKYRYISNAIYACEDYLIDPSIKVVEAAEDYCESECDLLDFAGNRINPEGIKVLAGTAGFNGRCIVVREGTGENGLKGMMDFTGNFLGLVQWSWINMPWQDRFGMQDPETGLWGYLNDDGNIVIEPQFKEVGAFNGENSIVKTVIPKERVALIDSQGQYLVQPIWKNIIRLWEHFMVETPEGLFGVIDSNGNILISPRAITEEEKASSDEYFMIDPIDMLAKNFENQLKQREGGLNCYE